MRPGSDGGKDTMVRAGQRSAEGSCHHREAGPPQSSHYFNALFGSGTET